MSQSYTQKTILRDHAKKTYRKPPLWDVETLAELGKGIIALILVGIAAGLVMAAGRILWEVADRYAYALAVWITG